MTDERRTHRMAGCACLGKGLLAAGVLALAVLWLNQGLFMTDQGGIHLLVRSAVKDLKNALDQYKADYNHFPLPASSAPNLDLSLRSRGPILPALLGEETGGLNPKKVKFLDLPMARNRKSGLWQDGAEWVLSDRWGEPYYIVLDTNKDGQIANPEVGSEHLPAMLPVEIIIYSSGPDCDPKTWQDNVCSWRSR
ncbi:MAG: hypothetical protein NTY98_22115 [Verrucomicrobia bacterium]|nr:hypothetical protein [Verrucomicrobiota bacterium]